MRLLLAVVALAVVALVPIAAPAFAEQPLAIFVHGSAAHTRLLPTYDSVLPIRVRVAGDARRFDAVTVTANGPDGRSVTAPLVKGASGFIGSLQLKVPGTWTLALTTPRRDRERGARRRSDRRCDAGRGRSVCHWSIRIRATVVLRRVHAHRAAALVYET